MTQTHHAAFFGYGSLVNRATHDCAPGAPARLRGWRRVWRQTRLRPFAYLSVEPADAEIDGLVAAVPKDDWTLLDAREAAYRRHPLRAADLSALPGWAARVEVYAIDESHADRAARHPILLSYLDTVVQGFLGEFGAPGAARFFASTAGWTAIRDDRAAPLYPRHQRLRTEERDLVDHHLAALGLGRA